ncbi:MAG: ATP-dependent helicase, partial [Flavobacterium sp.]|nr:ATP-dependent helicase [Flavobacterium sp.]
HILRYLKNSNDLQAKANFLYYLASQQDQLAIHDFIAQGMEQKTETEFQKWLTTFEIDFSFQNIRKKSLYEATEIIIAKVIPMHKRNAYIQFFLDLILEHDLKKQAGISDFLYYWDNNSEKLSIPSPEGNDAVRIMTIHKSKGLEFPVVIFPFAEEDYSKGPREKMWLNADEKITGLPKALVDKSSKVEGYGEEATLIYQQKKQEELLDNINVLYVALTRAEEHLYIISGMQSRSKTSGEYPNNMATFFIKFLGNDFDESKFDYQFGKAEKLSETKDLVDATETIPQLSATLNPKNIKIAQKESLMWNTQQQKAIEFGNILHEILSFVKTKDDIDLALIKAIENGLIVASQKDEVEQTIQQVVNHSDLQSYFAIGNKILNEKTIIQKEGNLVKPDRMVLNTNQEIYLLDYKTGAHQAKYTSQLENYQYAIEKMGFKVTKKALVYIGERLEIVNL